MLMTVFYYVPVHAESPSTRKIAGLTFYSVMDSLLKRVEAFKFVLNMSKFIYKNKEQTLSSSLQMYFIFLKKGEGACCFH